MLQQKEGPSLPNGLIHNLLLDNKVNNQPTYEETDKKEIIVFVQWKFCGRFIKKSGLVLLHILAKSKS